MLTTLIVTIWCITTIAKGAETEAEMYPEREMRALFQEIKLEDSDGEIIHIGDKDSAIAEKRTYFIKYLGIINDETLLTQLIEGGVIDSDIPAIIIRSPNNEYTKQDLTIEEKEFISEIFPSNGRSVFQGENTEQREKLPETSVDFKKGLIMLRSYMKNVQSGDIYDLTLYYQKKKADFKYYGPKSQEEAMKILDPENYLAQEFRLVFSKGE